MWSALLWLQYYRRYEEIRSSFDNFGSILQNLNLNEILNISGNVESTKKADHILYRSRRILWLLIQESFMLNLVDD